MLEKGFTNPTDRAVRLKNMILHAKPHVESERAVLATDAYKENEHLPAIMRRAKVVEKIFNELPVTIRADELIVGAVTINPRSTEICPEFSYDWVEKEFDTMEHRVADPFVIPKKTAEELHQAFKYWPGKTTSSLAASYMSEGTKESMGNGVFTVGNYFFGGVGHVCVDYGKVLKIGFRGIINEVTRALESIDRSSPDYIRKERRYPA
jgi:pyruvate-formate lyase